MYNNVMVKERYNKTSHRHKPFKETDDSGLLTMPPHGFLDLSCKEHKLQLAVSAS
jgi:hypothetical protein